jgi:serine/threonine protein kinase
MQHLQPNTTLQGGRYKIKDVLGQGGFGITYLAKDNSLGVYVAVKEFFMKDLCSRDEVTQTMNSSGGSIKQVERYREKFIKEARNLSRLHHLHIISVIDVFEENGTVYYSMPYLKGGSLQDYVKSRGPLTEVEAMKIIRQIADALKYMHEVEHICHYDVKPSNILLDDRGNAMLIDFGIAKNYDESGHETSTTPIGKSEGYAPIEQYQQNVEEFSPASDVYGLGATLLFAMTGHRPPSVIDRVSGVPLEMPRYCSDAVKNIITSSTIIQKKYRPQSVKAFLDYNLSNGAANSGRSNTVLPQNEDTIIENKPSSPNNYGTYSKQNYTQTNYNPNQNKSDSYKQRPAQSNHKQSASFKPSTDFSGFFIFLGIIVVGIFCFLLYINTNLKIKQNKQSSKIEEFSDYAQENPVQTSNEDNLSERVNEFARKQKNVIASFPNDNRHCVYYSKPTTYGHKLLYRYNALNDNTEEVMLPIQATIGFTASWLTKNRFIFIAAEERYVDFIRLDTQTGQVNYITDCYSVERSSGGFTVTKARCINEDTAQSSAEMEFAYTEHYYDEEGNYLGNRGEYR